MSRGSSTRLSTGFDVQVKSVKKRLSYLENYLNAAGRVKMIVKAVYPETRLYVFDSVVGAQFTTAGDVDVLVVLGHAPTLDERAKRRAGVFLAMPDAPVELHITDEEELRHWYL